MHCIKTADLLFEPLHKNIRLPEYAHEPDENGEDSGFDFFSPVEAIVRFGYITKINTGLLVNIPRGQEIQLRPRSGLYNNFGVRVGNTPSTIDSNYKGEIKILLTCDLIDVPPYKIKVGDRIAQGVLAEKIYANIKRGTVDENGKRGLGGLGSSGR